MTDYAEWGPLAGLIGEWEGDAGLDISFAQRRGRASARRRTARRSSMKPFGPVDNGTQPLYGLDYRMAAWRGDRGEPVPHRGRLLAVGRAPTGEVMRCFMVPRGSTRARGRHRRSADDDDRSRWRPTSAPRCTASCRTSTSPRRRARTKYTCTVTIDGDGTWSYDETDHDYDHAIGGDDRAHRPQHAAPRRLSDAAGLSRG